MSTDNTLGSQIYAGSAYRENPGDGHTRKKGLDECARLVRKTDVVESLLLNIRFRHPSPELDGKGRIAYTIEKLKEAPLSLKKKIADDPGCLKSGKISGKFRA